MAKSIKLESGLIIKKAKAVTRSVIQIDGRPVYFRMDGPIHEAPLSEGQKRKIGPDGKEMRSPDIAHVTNLETGEEATVVANSVLKSELMSCYPNESYIGRSFCVEKTGTKRSANGTNYSTFVIMEVSVEAPADVDEPAKPTARVKAVEATNKKR